MGRGKGEGRCGAEGSGRSGGRVGFADRAGVVYGRGVVTMAVVVAAQVLAFLQL